MRWSALFLLVACHGEYDVRVSFADGADQERAVRVQVAVVEDCSRQRLGEAPVLPVRTVEFEVGGASPALGDVSPGSYGLYGRATDGACNVVAAGCTPVTLEKGGDAPLVVLLAGVDVPLCDRGVVCVAGQCSDRDGGVSDAPDVVDAGTDVSDDAATDAPVDTNDDVPVDAGDDASVDAGEDVGMDGGADDSLVAYFPCSLIGSTLPDESGNGHDGTCIGGCPALGAGRVGTSCVFDGSAARVRVPYTPAFDAVAGFTVALWVNPDNVMNASPVSIPYGTASANTWQLFLFPSGTDLLSRFITGPDGLVGPALLTGSWTHIAMSYDGTTKTMFVNGVLVGTSGGGVVASDGQDVFIGADENAGAPAFPYAGRLDELRIYDRGLSPAEIAALAVDGL